jgi:hypothetical protein
LGKRYATDEGIEWQEKAVVKELDGPAGWFKVSTCVVAASHSPACLGV